MKKKYLNIDVHSALNERLSFLFSEFDNILVSFSGGKDSGVLLNLVLDYKRRYYPSKKIGIYHQDFEAQYSYTTEYVARTFKRLSDECELYWVCLPTATRSAASTLQPYWYPWDDKKQDQWIRPMPTGDYVINLQSNPITTYKYKTEQELLPWQFGRWYASTHSGKTVCLLGIRTDESMARYSGIVHKKHLYKEKCYITYHTEGYYTASPIYDWSVSDIWTANYRFGYDYNRLYDIMYKAGRSPEKMRVASPFSEAAIESLNLYRIIEPDTWARLLCRVQGVNFASIYGGTKAMGYGRIEPPQGYTWKSYTMFLLSTLPENIRRGYIKKFTTSIRFWRGTGGGLPDTTINELLENGYRIAFNGVSNYTVKHHKKVIFLDSIPDHTDDIKSTKDIPSWKRMCLCILKNDYLCKSMGFSISHQQKALVDEIRKKYQSLQEVR